MNMQPTDIDLTSLFNKGVPVNAIFAALGRTVFNTIPNVPYCVRCASSIKTTIFSDSFNTFKFSPLIS